MRVGSTPYTGWSTGGAGPRLRHCDVSDGKRVIPRFDWLAEKRGQQERGNGFALDDCHNPADFVALGNG
jgi:hypothetical protein